MLVYTKNYTTSRLHCLNAELNIRSHRRRLCEAAGARAPIIEKCPCICHFLPPSAPPIFWFDHPIFLTSLLQCTEQYFLTKSAVRLFTGWMTGRQHVRPNPCTHFQ